MLNRPMIFAANLVLPALFVFFLASCGGNTRIKPSDATHNPTAQRDVKFQNKGSTINELLAKAQQQRSPERENLLLQAADIYLEQNELEKASNLVATINPTKLLGPAFVNHSRISASIKLQNNAVEEARRILTNERLERQLNALEPQQETNLRELRAQVFERTGQLDSAVDERISLSALLTDKTASNHNQEALWKTLMQIRLANLEATAVKGAGGITQGWYSLATISKNNTLSIDTQQFMLTQWLHRWPNHPANGNLPKELGLLQKMVSQQPQKIALLLPLQGRLAEAGEAVSDGFFSAYYHAIKEQQKAPSVQRYDTSSDAIAAYQQAVADGADLVIGPLDKEDVNKLSRLEVLPVPILSLNYVSTSGNVSTNSIVSTNGIVPTSSIPANSISNNNISNNNVAADAKIKSEPQAIPGLYQFGLSVEDGARQVARQGIQNGFKNAMIIANNQEWSERIAQTFNDEWLTLGGAIVGKTVFTTQDKFSETLRNTLLIDESQRRMSLLQQQLATKFEFSPRRRADIDMIFLAVTPSQGRQIRPTFAYYFANNIPTYATSNIYSGNLDAANNEDLNGVIFNTIPWLFDEANPEKIAIDENTKSSAVYSRLHALGVDAFHLFPRLSQLKIAPQMRIYGATGSLHLLADGRIEREQIWARFINGVAEQLPSFTDDINANKEP